MNRNRYFAWRSRKCFSSCGFTLIEILVSMSLLTVVMAAIFAFLWGASNYLQTGQNTADVTENARLGLNRITRELQQASTVEVADTSQVSFTVNFGAGDETVTYGFTPGTNGNMGTIWRSSTVGPQNVTLVNNVASVQFDYFGNDYRCDNAPADGLVTMAELQVCGGSQLSQIVRVDVTLNLASEGGSERSFVGQSWLRNRNMAGA